MVTKERLVEADLLRTAAILLIILTHLPDYFSLPGLQPYTVYTILLGNGLFVFLSGYLVHASMRGRRSSLASFMGHRLLRLMPLYWLALFAFALLVVSSDPGTLLIHAAGLQVVLAPALVTPMATLWFIGMILMFYLIYHLVIHRTSRARGMLLLAVLALLPLIAFREATGLLEVRFFLYYFVFVAGAMTCQSGLMERAGTRGIVLMSALTIAFLALFILDGSPLIGERPDHALPPRLMASMAIAGGLMISSTLMAWTVARRIAPGLPARTASVLAACSVASYFVYLFHRPALVIASSAMARLGMAAPLQLLVLLSIVLPAVFLAGYKVQRSADRLTRRLVGRRGRGRGAGRSAEHPQ